MWGRLNYKNRFYIVLFGAMVLIWLSFSLGFKRTIQLKENLALRIEQLSGINDAPLKLQHINKQLLEIEHLIGDLSGEDASPYLINKVGNYCDQNGIVLNEIPRKHIFRNNDYSIVTYNIIVKGPFNKLLQLLSELEIQSKAGRVKSVVFERKYNLKAKKNELFGTYYIQSIRDANPKEN